MADAYNITITIQDGVVTGVSGPSGGGTVFDPDERKKVRKSTYGLRPVDTLYDHDTKGEATLTIAGTRKCYMIIGGFKVEVPCP